MNHMSFNKYILSFCGGRDTVSNRRMPFKCMLIKIGIIPLLLLLLQSTIFAAQITPSEAVQSYLNIRSAPSKDGRVIGKLSPGEKVELIRTVDDWYEIRLSDGSTGFVSVSWTVKIDQPVDRERPEDSLRTEDQEAPEQEPAEAAKDTILLPSLQTLSDSLHKLSDDIDSLTTYISTLQAAYRSHTPSKKNSILLIVAIVAAVCAAIISLVPKRSPRVQEVPVVEAPKEIRSARKSYFVVSKPTIEQTHGTYCRFHVDFVNSGDHPAISFQVDVYMIDIDINKARLFREFQFSTANPVGSKDNITFDEEDIDFTDECSPKFVCIAIEYVDNELKRKMKQDFTYRWDGVKNGEISEKIESVDKDKSELVWLRVRELRWEKTSRFRSLHE